MCTRLGRVCDTLRFFLEVAVVAVALQRALSVIGHRDTDLGHLLGLLFTVLRFVDISST